jgi:hypothetical protein
MWLVEAEPANLDNPYPGEIFVARMGADHLGPPFRPGALVVMRVLGDGDSITAGALYILDDGDDVAIVRMLDHSADLWTVDEYLDGGACRRRCLSRKRWQPRALITVG